MPLTFVFGRWGFFGLESIYFYWGLESRPRHFVIGILYQDLFNDFILGIPELLYLWGTCVHRNFWYCLWGLKLTKSAGSKMCGHQHFHLSVVNYKPWQDFSRQESRYISWLSSGFWLLLWFCSFYFHIPLLMNSFHTLSWTYSPLSMSIFIIFDIVKM